MSSARSVRVALPGLRAAVLRLAGRGDRVRLPAAEWLVTRGRRETRPGLDWREWLLDGAGLGGGALARHPAGPCSAPLRDGQAVQGTWARAEPVHLLTALDHLQLAAPVPLPLAADERALLRATLDEHLAGSGFQLHDGGHGGWIVECPAGCDFTALEPAQAVGRNLRDCLPGGRDAVRVRALVNELQMVLHEHPVNERREARGLPAVNSLWLWGAGGTAEPLGSAAGWLVTDDAWLAGLWRLHRGQAGSVDDLPRLLDESSADLRIALADGTVTADDLARWDEAVLAPVRASLEAGRLGRMTLQVDKAALVHVAAAARWAFWRRPRPLHEVLA
jgi:hypothetical protein